MCYLLKEGLALLLNQREELFLFQVEICLEEICNGFPGGWLVFPRDYKQFFPQVDVCAGNPHLCQTILVAFQAGESRGGNPIDHLYPMSRPQQVHYKGGLLGAGLVKQPQCCGLSQGRLLESGVKKLLFVLR